MTETNNSSDLNLEEKAQQLLTLFHTDPEKYHLIMDHMCDQIELAAYKRFENSVANPLQGVSSLMNDLKKK